MRRRAALTAGEQPSCTHQEEEEGEEPRRSGDRQRALVMNCQLRLGVTRLYMTGQIHSRLPARGVGGVGDNET